MGFFLSSTFSAVCKFPFDPPMRAGGFISRLPGPISNIFVFI